MVKDNTRNPEILELLSSLFQAYGLEEEAKKVEQLDDESLPLVIDKLSQMEHATTKADLVRGIAMAKQALTGKADVAPFAEHCLRVSGLR